MQNEFFGVANINGKICPLNEAKISISDRGFLFGHSIFETILIKNGIITHWDEHFSRLLSSCKEAFILPPDKETLLLNVKETIQKNIQESGLISDKCQLRIIISGGNSFDLSIKKTSHSLPNSNFIIICRNVTGPSQDQYKNGISLMCIKDLRSQGLIDIKSCSYLYNLIALENAKNSGFDDALFYNAENNISESTTANFIWFNKELTVYSAPFKGQCLAGVTLNQLIVGLKKMKIPFDWSMLNRANMSGVKGCGIISSIRGIVPIKKIDEHEFDVHAYHDFFLKLNQAISNQ
ncbi:aminotransferase class IV [Pigmentibacter sp. JX0631]|uniref:aminotransferase class IV n=1 Tax=Pigmentibacter sp. JX0631 TaxID=2976982 RepID=UPI0024691895|nr:aminotransferase class IV [Pigmentibacter sp. JX0631]WGL58866.1 aminotransferase class IV [Pigmentibacter sp. JX0631]